MKVTNPNEDRPILASIDGKWHEVPAGESIDVEDYVVASTLVEYGATAGASDLAAARALWAERNRGINSRTASASASEGEILGRQAARAQTTVDVSTGTVEGPKGAALDEAVKVANEAGAKIDPKASAKDRREALAAFAALNGPTTDPADTDRFVEKDGDLVLDDDGQPIPLDDVVVGEDGEVEFDENGRPTYKVEVEGQTTP